ncbi:MAG: hypothetical protein EOQ95_30240 [Mesorhizobium sp.]|nr:MAG: hypothetical protein EOQ95_30240 [Mesorhizobium sp.]RWQ46650.1 MAG: hypothetical protein EOS84_30055 [Mesorhizobium sp.]
MRGVPAWHRRHSVQHPSTVLALRANPPSPTRGEGKLSNRVITPSRCAWRLAGTGLRRPARSGRCR